MSPQPIVTVFRSRLRADASDDYSRTADEMERLARDMPGFVDFKQFVAHDGERVSVITFASRAAHDAWRDDPRHRAAQERGREEWYAEYQIQVCELLAERTFGFDRMLAEGRIRPAVGRIEDLPLPPGPVSTGGTDALAADREGKE